MPYVVIIGGGFAGPVLALCLKKHGVTSAVYESRSAGYEHGGNIALAPNALRVLDHIGVYDRIRTRGFNYSELRFDNGAGEVLGKFLNGGRQVYNFDALRIHRSIVRDELIAELGRKGILVHYDKKCKQVVDETEHGVSVAFMDGETVEADFVIGADGIHSRIRPHIAPDSSPSFSGLLGVMGTVMADQLGDQGAGLELPCMLFGASGSFAIMPASFTGDEIGYFATIEANDRDRQGWTELENNKNELYDMLKGRFLTPESQWPAMVKALCEKSPPESLTSWPFFSVPHLESWSSSKGRVLLIGDAAHAIPPTGGQGAAMALEDAETLAYALERIHADKSTSSLKATIRAWQSHRTDRIARVVDFTTKNGTLRKSSPHAYQQAAKEWLIWAMFRWMGPQGGAEWMYGYNCESVLSVLS